MIIDCAIDGWKRHDNDSELSNHDNSCCGSRRYYRTNKQSMFGPSLEPVFRCQFVELADMYSYDIEWFINDDLVVDFKNTTYANIQTTLLKPSHWSSIYKLNILVRCSVRARNEYYIQIGPAYKSEIYTAGLIVSIFLEKLRKPDKFEYNVQEGKTVTVRYKVTVPIGCLGSLHVITSSCDQKFYLSLPEYQNRNQCNASTFSLNFHQYHCGFAISFNNWNQSVELVVHGKTTGLYFHTDRTMFLHLESVTSDSIWDNASIPEVKVVVSRVEYNMTGRQCHSYNDPHIRTVDGTQFDATEVGEYLLYRSKRGPYAVHVLFGSCVIGTALASCNCGIAIKNNQSLFLVRTCGTGSTAKMNIGSSSPYIERRNCDQSSMIIEEYGNFYQVTLPTGTEIEFYIADGLIPVININPSVLDVENTDGLCGFISSDGNAYDDFTLRDSQLVATDIKVFVDSWRASLSEQLLQLNRIYQRHILI
ncbi:unnamed protein product [Mytilus edulis]|uniref:VWFD domain-containing protein n=1 Tax=Mytilus edulis TaxID=6550 RepID=A0A8S3TC11_MYTED|nr:unnamed protein product [Mytilus edulis]